MQVQTGGGGEVQEQKEGGGDERWRREEEETFWFFWYPSGTENAPIHIRTRSVGPACVRERAWVRV